jgi:hypothetical protein
MKAWIYRIRLNSGGFVDIPIPGDSPGIARALAESVYGSQNILGCLGESR